MSLHMKINDLTFLSCIEKIQTAHGLVVIGKFSENVYWAAGFVGKQSKSKFYSGFTTLKEACDYCLNFLTQLKEIANLVIEAKKAKIERNKKLESQTCDWKVGDILSGSLSWEDTHAVFAIIQAIDGNQVTYQTVCHKPAGNVVVPDLEKEYSNNPIKTSKIDSFIDLDGNVSFSTNLSNSYRLKLWDKKPAHQSY